MTQFWAIADSYAELYLKRATCGNFHLLSFLYRLFWLHLTALVTEYISIHVYIELINQFLKRNTTV